MFDAVELYLVMELDAISALKGWWQDEAAE